ncbi:MAG TPA: antitoxin Xre/MbcA/ParS toxin-binding domain-containing protein [Chitinophagaceae bacterium]|nr:antitoxin Xre/MbcA/ParS toxin-binding domain-containing protein [Chitinophagaceae bacterium]
MKKTGAIKKPGEYILQQEGIASAVQEPAVKYKSLNVILGGKQSVSQPVSGDFDLIALTREGIRKSSLKSLAAHLGITMEVMSRLLHSSHRNIQRKDENELLDTLKTEKVLELAAFAQRGIEVAGSKEAFIEWVHSPLVSLNNKTPLDYLDTSFGIQLLLKLMGRLEQGVYS